MTEEIVKPWAPTPVTPQRYFSSSEMKTWKTCRREWAISYWLKMRPKGDGELVGHAALGTTVHGALQVHKDGGDPFAWLQVRAETERALISGPVALVANAADGPAQLDLGAAARAEQVVAHAKQCELAEIMVRGYLDWLEQSGVDEGTQVLGTERKVEVALAGQPGAEGLEHVILRGRLDTLLELTDGRRMVQDYKTVQDFKRVLGTIHMVEQFLFYLLLERMSPEHTEQVHGVAVDMLRKVKRSSTAKPPFYERELVTHSDVELRTFYRRTLRTIRDVLAMEDELNRVGLDELPIVAYPSPSQDCSWKCPHYNVCPMMDRQERWRDYLQAEYDSYDPADRYGSTEDET